MGSFTIVGFRNWKKVKSGKRCAFLKHMGEDPCSPHNNAIKCCLVLMNQSSHVDKVMERQSTEQIEKNRLRVKTSIDAIRWLALQGCALRGHDESIYSSNRGNFLELLKYTALYNPDVASIILENAPFNAKYTSPLIQKEILHICANKVRKFIREEIGESKFCIIVDESRDAAKREQMALVIRFVDGVGCVRERFFDLAHIKDLSAATMFSKLSDVLSHYGFDLQNLRGQGYDGASNMRGEWRGLQALFLREYPFAYYVHCMAHRLQLALMTAAKEVNDVHEFFLDLTFIINAVDASSKRHDELQAAQIDEISRMLAIDEIKTGRGLNQMCTLKRAGDTRWSSHFSSVCSLLRMYNATCVVLENIKNDGAHYKIKGDASAALKKIRSFEFIFIAHLMKEIMGITDVLCQTLQQKSQDIVNAMRLVSSTMSLIQTLRDDGWDSFLENVMTFCSNHEIVVQDLEGPYFEGRSCRRLDRITTRHHYHFDIFNATIDFQLQELNTRFNERVIELLKLSAALSPKDGYKSFDIEDICTIAEKYYPRDFKEQEMITLRYQLQHFYIDVSKHPELEGLSSIAELCQGLAETKKSMAYPLVDRLIRLILTLPVSTATTERAFSAMKLVKTRLRNRMEDEFLTDSLLIFIERDIMKTFDLDSLLDDFVSVKERRAQF